MVKEDKFKLIYAQFFPRGADTSGYARFVFNSFDIQRKQEITFTDFVIGLSVLTRGTIDEQLRWIFTLYDINGDGIITRDELNRIFISIHDLMGKFALNSGQAAALSEASRIGGINTSPGINNNLNQAQHAGSNTTLSNQEQAENLFKKFDLNNDGIITLDEFLEACHKVSLIKFSFPLEPNSYSITTRLTLSLIFFQSILFRMIILSSQYPFLIQSSEFHNNHNRHFGPANQLDLLYYIYRHKKHHAYFITN